VERERSSSLLLWLLGTLFLTAASVLALVPLVDLPPPSWPVPCETEDCPEKVTLLELETIKLRSSRWMKKGFD
jgi:hypothetical protein